MHIYGFKVIYKDRAYHCISLMPDCGEVNRNPNDPWTKPMFLSVTVINEDGAIRMIQDEAWMFQFVPKVEGR